MMDRKFSRIKIATFSNICLGIVFVLASVLIVTVVNHSMRREALHDAQIMTDVLLQRNLATHRYFTSELKPKLFEAFAPQQNDDYFEPVWMSSTYANHRIDEYFKSAGGYDDYYFKQCAINARSPHNEADDYEKAFIEELNQNPNLQSRSEIRTIDNEPYFVALRRGMKMAQSCLRCHSTPDKAPADMVKLYGPERSFNRNVNDAVSAVSIRIPLAAAYATTKTVSVKLSILLMIILTLIFTMQYIFTKWLVLRPLELLQNRSSNIAFSNQNFGEKLPLPFGKELRGLVSAFNNMSANLQRSRDALEEKVKHRTADL